MTIAVGIASPEGIVLAADSRSSMITESSFRIASDHAQKLFNIWDRYAVVTWGWAYLDEKTIAGVMDEFEATMDVQPTVDAMTDSILGFFADRLERHLASGKDARPDADTDVLGFMIGGYDSSGIGHLKRVWLPSKRVEEGAATNSPGIFWSGETEPIVRLVKGFDPFRFDPAHLPKEDLERIEGAEYLLMIGSMALQDAIDLAAFFVRLTVDTQRFSHGTVAEPGSNPTCGGPVNIASVTGKGVHWIQRTKPRPPSVAGVAEGARP